MIKIKRVCSFFFISLIISSVTFAAEFPGPDPGKALAYENDDVYTLENNILSVSFKVDDNNLRILKVMDKIHHEDTIQVGELFRLELGNGISIVDENMEMGDVLITRIPKDLKAIKLAERFDGWAITIPLTYTHNDNILTVHFSASLRDGSNYVIQNVTYSSTLGDWDVKQIQLIDVMADHITLMGEVKGSPFFVDHLFFAQQTPVAINQVSNNRATGYVERGDITKEGDSFSQSSVFGIYPDVQKRRAFQYYLQRERVKEHSNFLHYNSWYDLSWITDELMTEANSIHRIHIIGSELIQKRGVNLQNFLFDDGYDDYSATAKNIWDINPITYPGGFIKMREAAESYGASLGAWMSPTGGYYHKLPARVSIGKRMTPPTETKMSGTEEIFKMSGPHYYKTFKNAVFQKQNVEGVKHFKFDRTEGIEDFHALLKLTGEIRKNDPDVFVNATIGTWGSPYFFLYVDSIWRGGYDVAHIGTGSNRQRWLNYRDDRLRDVVRRNPMLPLNSLMAHGIVHSRIWHSGLDMNDPLNLKDFRDEVRSYFCYGFNLQELYITPTPFYMTDQMWDIIAESSKWGEENHDVLLDSHFFGGNPGSGQPYGVAAWASDKGILLLRNPESKPQTITVVLKTVFQLPAGAATEYTLIDPYESTQPGLNLAAGKPYTFTIEPHAILIYEALPKGAEALVN